MMNIYQKLIEVRKEVPYLQKESKGYQYNYCGSSQVLSAVRSKMDELGLLLVPRVLSYRLFLKSEIDSKEHLTEIEIEFTWINAEKPDETITCPWYGQGLDTGEKGVGKALTYAEKYFILKFFNIATDKDDPDSFQNGETRKKNSNTPGKPRPERDSSQTGQLTKKQIMRFYAIANQSGANDKDARAVIAHIAPGAMVNGKTEWSKVNRETYDQLCDLFESGEWRNMQEDDLDLNELDAFLNQTG